MSRSGVNPTRRARLGLVVAAAMALSITAHVPAVAQDDDPPLYRGGFAVEPSRLNVARVVAGEVSEVVMTVTIEGEGEIDTPELQIKYDVYDPQYLGEMELVEESSDPVIRRYEYRYQVTTDDNGWPVGEGDRSLSEGRWQVQLKADGVVRRDLGWVPLDDYSTVGGYSVYHATLVTPAGVMFDYDAGTYTVPEVDGVNYLVGRRTISPGTYTGSGQVTVSAEPRRNYEFPHGATARWTHTFPMRGVPTFHLNNGWDGVPEHVFPYGRANDEVLIGDWDRDGRDTITVRRGNVFYVSNALRGGDSDDAFVYGRPGDVILVGDWNGDGTDTLAVRRGQEYHMKNSLRGGVADHVIFYGRADDAVMVGDWDGDGTDTFAVRRGRTYHVKNSIAGGDADVSFTYGRTADITLAGDWDGDGTDTFAVRRGQIYHVKNSLRGGPADFTQAYGRADDEVYVGDWNGDGRDTLAVRRIG